MKTTRDLKADTVKDLLYRGGRLFVLKQGDGLLHYESVLIGTVSPLMVSKLISAGEISVAERRDTTTVYRWTN